MSTPILPFAVWQPGQNQNSIPANDNSLRNQILNGLVIGVENDAPGGDADGDIYIVGDTPAGAFAGFNENDLAIYMDGTWYAFAPVAGIVVNVAGALKRWDGSAYVDAATGVGGAWGTITGTLNDQTDLVSALDDVAPITEASAFDIVPATHAGRRRWILAGGDVTFDSGEAFAAGQVYAITATAPIELLEAGVTLTPPAGGTLDMDADMSVEVRMTSGTAGRVIGQTVAA